MHTLTSNETRELSSEELSIVTGGGQGTSNSGTNWGLVARVADAATYAASSVVSGAGGIVGALAAEGAASTVKQLRE